MYAISFLAPWRLALLVLPVALVAAYLLVQRRRKTYTLRFTNLDLLDSVAPKRPGWRRHVPAAALVLGVALATLAFARPAVATEVASNDGVIVLALDTSLSMEATDVTPNRLDAAKEAAKAFLRQVPAGVQVGIVGFDQTARQVMAPTKNRAAAERAIDRLQLGEGTAIGEAVFESLDSIQRAFDAPAKDAKPAAAPAAKQGAAGQPAPGTIVLLSDGETTAGRPNAEATDEAVKRGVSVNTIAFGTDEGTVVTPDGQTVKVPVNRDALREIATTTKGNAYDAYTAEQLKQIYERLGKGVSTEPVQREVTDWFTFGSLGLVAVAAMASLVWFGRLP